MATWKQVLTTADDASYLNSNVNAFKTVSVGGQSDVVADAETDALTYVGAGGMVITTAAASDTITFTAPDDVDVSAANLKTRLAGAFAGNALTIGEAVSEVTVGDNLTVTGNLTVSGTTTTVTSETVNIADNEIVLNSNISDNSGSAATDGGIRIKRGFNNNSYEPIIFWDESANNFAMTSYAATDRAVDANGAMTDVVTPLRLASGVPSSVLATGLQAASLGSLYMDTSSKKLYVCTAKDNVIS